MTKTNTAALAAFLVAILSASAMAAAIKAGLYVAKHEGDTLHLMQIVLRMADGQVPHLDFMTPIGAFAFWPIAMLVKAGFGIGNAILWAQIGMAALFLPAILWVAATRLKPWVGALFGMIIMVLLLALVHGEAERSVSISMHYNRWAWAAFFIAIVAALIPPTKPRTATLDGVVLGLMLSVLAMVKMTYFVAFALPVLLALLLTHQYRATVVAAFTGVAVVACVTLFVGADYWFAYAQDLLRVAGSDIRPAPGAPLSAVMAAPAYLGGSLVALASVIFLRQAKVATGGLIILLLIPGFFFVTYQNFGNDPQWLLLLVVLLLALRDDVDGAFNGWGWDLRALLGIMAAMAMAFTAPSFFNLVYSPFRHLHVDVAEYAPILPRSGIHTDLQSADMRVNRIDARVAYDGQVAGLERYEDRPEPPSFQGEVLPECSIEIGLPRYMDVITRDLEDAGYAGGASIFAADLFSSYWLFGDLDPMQGGAPWYYGGLPGIDDADYLLVPLCPVILSAQAQILETVEEAQIGPVTEIRRTPLYILFDLGKG